MDATLNSCSAALWKGGGIVAEAEETSPNRQAARLVPLIQQLLADGATRYDELTAVACTTGPGGFTGIRIGLATAKAVALAADLPLAGVTTLEAMAWQAAQRADDGSTIAVAMNAYRGEIYLQSFLWQAGALPATTEPAAFSPEDAVKHLPQRGYLAGDAQTLLAAAIAGSEKEIAPCRDVTRPSARAVAELAVRGRIFSSTRRAAPLYIRPPDAKLPVE